MALASTAGFRVGCMTRSAHLPRDGGAHGARLPVVETTLADYALLLASGHGEEDISTIFRLKTPLFTERSR